MFQAFHAFQAFQAFQPFQIRTGSGSDWVLFQSKIRSPKSKSIRPLRPTRVVRSFFNPKSEIPNRMLPYPDGEVNCDMR